jgi:hypothetical protein
MGGVKAKKDEPKSPAGPQKFFRYRWGVRQGLKQLGPRPIHPKIVLSLEVSNSKTELYIAAIYHKYTILCI